MSDTDSKNFNVDLDNYNGPLDVLLDLAKALFSFALEAPTKSSDISKSSTLNRPAPGRM